MSKRHKEYCCKEYREPCCDYGYGGHGGYGGYGMGMGGYSNIYSLLILILIVCQFCKKKKDWDHEEEEHGVDNSILFIIAIFVLVFCSCGKGLFGGKSGY